MHTNRLRVVLALVAGLLAVFGASLSNAQNLGTFRWQFAPFCNVVTLAVEQQGDAFLLTGFDDQCGGGAVRAAAAGAAFINPDGSIGMGFTIVTPTAVATHVDATLSANLSGTWRDADGNTGPFAFNPASVTGSPRPAPDALTLFLGPMPLPVTARPSITAPAGGSLVQSGNTVRFAWTAAAPGVPQYLLEFTGPGGQFANPNGTAPDPLNGLGGTGGGIPVNGPAVTVVIPPSLPTGSYQARVIGRAATGQFLGSFSDAVTFTVAGGPPPPTAGCSTGSLTGPATGTPDQRATITAPASGSAVARGSAVTFAWTALSGVTRYLLEQTGPGLQFANPNGTTPDPVNGFGGAGTGFFCEGTAVAITVSSSLPPGLYLQFRVIGLSQQGGLVGTFSDAVTLVIQ